jgi:hypothetical protein
MANPTAGYRSLRTGPRLRLGDAARGGVAWTEGKCTLVRSTGQASRALAVPQVPRHCGARLLSASAARRSHPHRSRSLDTFNSRRYSATARQDLAELRESMQDRKQCPFRLDAEYRLRFAASIRSWARDHNWISAIRPHLSTVGNEAWPRQRSSIRAVPGGGFWSPLLMRRPGMRRPGQFHC